MSSLFIEFYGWLLIKFWSKTNKQERNTSFNIFSELVWIRKVKCTRKINKQMGSKSMHTTKYSTTLRWRNTKDSFHWYHSESSANIIQTKYYRTYEFVASLKPFSIAGIKPDCITCPTTMSTNKFLWQEKQRSSVNGKSVQAEYKCLQFLYPELNETCGRLPVVLVSNRWTTTSKFFCEV